MELDNNTLQNWTRELEKEIKASSLLDFTINNKDSIRIMKDDFISLFNDIIKGGVSKICKLDNFLSLSQAIASYQKDNELTGNELFTNLNKDEQQEILKLVKERSDESIKNNSTTNAYLCFGLLRYNLDVFSKASKQAPLVLIPITLSYSEEKDTYSIKGVEGEVYLNQVLLDRIKKQRRIDLSYPIDSNFSISDFLYYISVKIQTLNWNLSNQVFISTFDLFKYNDFLEIRDKKEEIINHEIIKKISYFNSQFYSFQEKSRKPLDSKYLSILEMDNDEYSILKRVSARENMIIKTNDFEAKIHLISNTILSYMLNNMKTLVVYSNEEEKNELLKYIETQGYFSYVCDLNPISTNKSDLLADIVNYDSHLLPYNEAKQNLVNEDLQKYYDLKNDYKKLTNQLRTIENPIHISLNKLVNEYYRLEQYPLINISLNEPNRLTGEDLTRYMDYISSFARTITSLECPIEKHPFYGFNRKIMKKEDYLLLKESVTNLSSYLPDVLTLINIGVKKYSYPEIKNLKELKALLNILSFIDEYKAKKEWVNDKNLRKNFEEIKEIRHNIEQLKEERKRQTDKYTRKILFINEELVNEYLETKSNKTKAKIRKLLGKQFPLNHIDAIIEELKVYYQNIEDTKLLTNEHDPKMVEMMRNNELDLLDSYIRHIMMYRASLRYIEDKKDFDVTKYIGNKDENRLIHRKALQNAYNLILKHCKELQSFIDKTIFDFSTLEFNDFSNKVTSMATSFIKINDYTDFYKSLLDTNDFITNLGNELIKAGKPDEFKNIFLRKFYFDVINERITSNALLKNNTRQNLYDQLNHFSSTDDRRKEMINGVISNNIDSYLKRNLLRLKHEEAEKVYQLFSKNPKFITMNMITSLAKESLYTIKPCIMISYKNISKFLSDSIYKFDSIIFLPRKNMMMSDVLSSFTHSSTCIVFDEDYISKDPRNKITLDVNDLDDTFLINARYTYHLSNYVSDKKNIIIHNSKLDHNVKLHIANILTKHGFEVRVDYPIRSYIMDILVRVPDTKNVIAIELNHLPYNSPEDTYKSFILENSIIEDMGFIPYRIFTSSYFFNEEIENAELIDFIVKKSNIIPQEKIKRKEVRLMDYLFVPYIDPHLVYYKMNKQTSNIEEITLEIINKCAPIAIKDLSNIVKVNIKGIIKRFVHEGNIIIEDDYIYKPNEAVEFRRVNRDENFIRPLKYVSNKEIYDAIYKIVANQKSIDQDVLVKMILLSLGYKKMNKESYDSILDCIEFLLKSKIIFNNETTLYSDIV